MTQSLAARDDILIVAGRRRRRQSAEVDFDASPWGLRDLGRYASFTAVGALGAAVSCYRVGGEATWNPQAGWMLTGLVSTALGLMGVLTWLIAGTRNIKSAERDLLRRYTAVYESATGRPLGGLVGSHASANGLESDDTRVSAPGMRAYHRTSCPVVRGKAIVLQAASEFDERRACAMCQP